ncbi:hypothetical protein SGRIM128S_07266 [Streptomyces griseomycini]
MTSARKLGTSDLEVFPLSLGGNVFGWTANEAESFGVLDAYTAAGGNFIDTADSYSAWVPGNGGGESETIIGNSFNTRGNRSDVVIATKVRQHPEPHGLTSANIKAGADASLQRLDTDYIDLYYTHFDEPAVPVEEIVTTLDELVKAGKVLHIAASNISADRLQAHLALSEREDLARYVALQPHYNLVSRDTFKGELPRHRTAPPRGHPVLLPGVRLPDRQVPPGHDGRQPAGPGRRPAPGDRAGPEGPRRPRRRRPGPPRRGRLGRPRLARRPAHSRRADRHRQDRRPAPGPADGGRPPADDAELALLTEASA